MIGKGHHRNFMTEGRSTSSRAVNQGDTALARKRSRSRPRARWTLPALAVGTGNKVHPSSPFNRLGRHRLLTPGAWSRKFNGSRRWRGLPVAVRRSPRSCATGAAADGPGGGRASASRLVGPGNETFDTLAAIAMPKGHGQEASIGLVNVPAEEGGGQAIARGKFRTVVPAAGHGTEDRRRLDQGLPPRRLTSCWTAAIAAGPSAADG